MTLSKLTLALAGAFMTVHAGTINVISNGTFETGAGGWTAATTTFANVTGACNSGFSPQTTASGCAPGTNPIFGSLGAYSSTQFPAISADLGQFTNEFYQSFPIPSSPISSAILTWADTATWSGTGTFRGVNVFVGFLQGSSQLANTFSVVNPNASGSTPWTNRSLDVTALLNARLGQTLTLRLVSAAFYDTRFGSNSSATALNTGFDNVALHITGPNIQDVPEPGGLALILTGFVGMALIKGKKRR
jgi:hypothetical protein